jgi:hypothetical protein
MMRAPATWIGTGLVVVGLVWSLQGLGYLTGSPMTGATLWAILGPIAALAGVWLLVRAARRRRQ